MKIDWIKQIIFLKHFTSCVIHAIWNKSKSVIKESNITPLLVANCPKWRLCLTISMGTGDGSWVLVLVHVYLYKYRSNDVKTYLPAVREPGLWTQKIAATNNHRALGADIIVVIDLFIHNNMSADNLGTCDMIKGNTFSSRPLGIADSCIAKPLIKETAPALTNYI